MNKMKIIIFSVIATISFVLILSVLTYERKEVIYKSGEASKVSIGENVYDFGVVSKDEIVTHRFYILNNGKNKLLIKDIIPSCECTSVAYNKKVISTNEKFEITATFFSGKVKSGKIISKIYVDMGSESLLEFTIKGVVKDF